MDRLIKDAAKLDKTFKYNTKTVVKNKKAVKELDYTYADIVKAIHIVQTNMGITGTTAKEATETISGSINMLKAAWQNLLTGMGTGNELNLDKLVANVVEAARTVFKNIQPIIINALYGIAHLVEQLAPIIAAELPRLVKKVLPKVIDAAAAIIQAIFTALPGIATKGIPMVIRAVGKVVTGLIKAMPSLLKKVVRYLRYDFLPDIAWAIADVFGGGYDMANKIYHGMTGVVDTVTSIIKGIINYFKTMWPVIQPILQSIIDFVTGTLIPAVSNAIQFITDNIDTILPVVGAVLAGIAALNIAGKISNVMNLVSKGIGVVKGLFSLIMAHPFAAIIAAIVAVGVWLVHLYQTNDEFRDKVNAAWEQIKQFWENTLKPVFEALWDYVVNTVAPALVKAWQEDILPAIENAITAISGFWENTLKPALEALWDFVVNTLVPAMEEAWTQTIQPAIETVFNDIATLWEEHAKPALEAFWTFVTETLIPMIGDLGTQFQTVWDTYLVPLFNWIGDSFVVAWDGLKDTLSGLLDFITGVFSGDWEKAWKGLVQMVKAPFDTLKEILKKPINAVIGLINSMIEKVESAINAIVNGINSHLRIKLNPIYVFGRKVWDGLDWGPSLTPVQWGRIQQLAGGGVLGEGQRAIVGEYQPEYLRVVNGRAIVTPTNSGRFGQEETVTRRIAPKMQTVILQLRDGTELGRVIHQLYDDEDQRIGVKLAKGVV